MKVFNLRKVRTAHKMSQQQMAEILKLPQSSISAMENGRTPVNQNYIDVICTTLDLNAEDYMDEESSVFVSRVKGNFNGYNNNISTGDESSSQAINMAMESMKSTINRDAHRYDELKKELDKIRAERDQLKEEINALRLKAALRGIEL